MKRTLLFIIFVFLLFLVACNLPATSDAPASSATDEGLLSVATLAATNAIAPTPTSLSAASGDEQVASDGLFGAEGNPLGINPLTGLAVDNPGLLERRPVSVKINNYPRTSRPQWGLSLADIVYEYYHNNDLPRFHAIFYGNNASQVGPIRSGRLFDDYLLQMYGSDFAFGSADVRILNHLKAGAYADQLVYSLSGICPPTPVCRIDPAGYNFLVADTAAVNQFVSARGVPDVPPNLSGMRFSEHIPEGGIPVEQAYLRYSYGAYLYWDFNPSMGNYIRMQDTQEDIQGWGEAYAPLTDRLTGQTITAENVVFLIVRHFHEVYIPAEGETPKVEIVNMDFEVDGKAFALRDGLMYELHWVRPENGGVLYLVFPDGTRYPFKPGNTWFEVISTETKRTLNDGVLRYDFHFSPPQ